MLPKFGAGWRVGTLLLTAFLAACGAGTETKGPTSSVTSPDGASVVEIYEVMGGGAAGYAYQELRMKTPGYPEGSAFARISHGKDLSVAWLRDDTVLVFFADGLVTNFMSGVYDAKRSRYVKVELCRVGSVTCTVMPESFLRRP